MLIEDLTDQDIQEAIAAAKSVGDDTIQQTVNGKVSPEQWTHGSSAARVHGSPSASRTARSLPATSSTVSPWSSRSEPQQGLDLAELPLQRPEVRRDGGVAVLAGQRALAAGDPGQRPLGP